MDEPLFISIVVFLFFAAQHSLTISDLFKAWVMKVLGQSFYDRYFRLLFTLFNGTLLVLLLHVLLSLPDRPLFAPSIQIRTGMRILQCLGVWILYRAGKHFDLLHFIGVRQVMARNRQQSRGYDGLIREGIYGKVRHPLYLGSLFLLWGEPRLVGMRNGLTLVILSSLYFYFGSMLEERRMVRQYGAAYRKYQDEVPRLFPVRWE